MGDENEDSNKDTQQGHLPDFSDMDAENRPPGSVQNLLVKAHQLSNERGNPLLIIYYSNQYGAMREYDYEILYDFLNSEIGVEERVEELDVVIHTVGGSPHTGYRMPRIIHEYAETVNALVPKRAFSAGTLFCLGCEKIFLTRLGELSPIDVKYRESEEEDFIQLVGIDNYTDFIRKIKKDLDEDKVETTIEENLGVELVEQVGALKLGNLFRKRDLTGDYAKELLENHLLSRHKDNVREEHAEEIIKELIFNNPGHNFRIDKCLAASKNIPVNETSPTVGRLSIDLIDQIVKCEQKGLVCEYTGDGVKDPYIEFIGDVQNDN